MLVDQNYPDCPVKPGQVYRHHKGGIYTVVFVANTANPACHKPDAKFPITVVYLGSNGNVWTRPLEQFMDPEKFTKVYDGGHLSREQP